MPKNIDNKQIYTVSQLNIEAKHVLESSFPLIWVEGEISNFSAPRSGHIYFSLKDAYSQTRCAMFRMKRQLLRFSPENGLKVLLRARITLYEARGDFQLVVEHMELAGEGQLRQAIEQLKIKLQSEGLFDNKHKKDLPRLPQTVGVITSPSGAAITDVLKVFRRRFPAIEIIIYPVPVQGENAVKEIVSMLALADTRKECDLIILTRGGGSLEDLMAFNDETMARKIFSMNIPIISAIGHEIDTSISDYVADRRAPTPSAAAELASPDQDYINKELQRLMSRLQRQNKIILGNKKQQLEQLSQRIDLQSPEKQLQSKNQSLDILDHRLHQAIQDKIQYQLQQYQQLTHRLNQLSPQQKVIQFKSDLKNLIHRLHRGIDHKLNQSKDHLQTQLRILESVNPLATLSRGYAIAKDDQGNLLKDTQHLKKGRSILVQLSNGSLHCDITKITP